MHDAVVVGGGPAGTITAGLLAKDHDVVVLEEHASSGLPLQCTGLVTPEAMRICGVSPDILNRIRGADVVFPGGGVLEVRAKGIMAFLIDRPDLDRKLAEKAVDMGAEIRYGVKYAGHKVSADGVSVSTSGGEAEAKLIIGADGQNSGVAMSLGSNLPKEYVRGIQADVRRTSGHEEVMTLRIGSEFAPGFFSWEIPFEDTVRVGLCISAGTGSTPNEHLKRLLKASRIDEGDVISKHAGKIPLGGRPRSYGERTLLIGDAAGHVKPVSGGGLFPIFKAAPILGRTVSESLRDGIATSGYLSKYEKSWKKELGKEFSRGYKIRRTFTRLSDKDLEKIFTIMDRDDMRSVLNGIDIDNPSGIASPILRNPHVGVRLLPIMLRAIL
ncbi:MAG: NAD(P)/FAD-dependent oxidoreductase [Methanomassiliicoccaceae archaeon]|nr:NAD(P)/FAD-dependent oxidoreductase [Methanomassiliicoccaceae archaeon]